MLRTRRSPFTLAAAVALTFALGACGGGGSSLPASGIGSVTQPTTPTQNDNAPAKMVISIPPKSAASSMRNPKYISASTKSMTIGILSNGKTTQVAEADLTPTSPSCAVVSGGATQCTVNFLGAAGSNTFVLTMYDAIGGKGNVLSTGNVNATLTAGTNTTIAVDLDGVPASLSLVLGVASLPVGAASTTSVTVQANDADGNLIIGPGGFASPITLAITGDTYKTLALSSTTVSSPGQLVTLGYDGGSNVGSTITPSASGVTSATAATFGASGASLTLFEYFDTVNNIYGQPSAIAASSNGTAAIMLELEGPSYCCSDAIAIASPSGYQKVFAGDTTDPYNLPAAGSVTVPGATIVHGMAQNLESEEFEAYGGVAVNPTSGLIYYATVFSTTSAPNCSGQNEYSGTLGVLNPTAGTATEKILKGIPGSIHVDTTGNVWFLEYSGQCNGTNLLGSDEFAIGELSSSGTLTETPFSVAGLSAINYPGDMSISPDGSQMYIGADDSTGVYKIATASMSAAVNAAVTNTPDIMTIASAPDGTTAWFSDDEPAENYFYGYIPGSKAFSTTNVSETPFPINTFYSYDMAYADGSFWMAGAENGTGIGRLSGLASGTPVSGYYAMPNPSANAGCCGSNYAGQQLEGISAAGGYVWAADDNYANIDILQYGAPNNGTVTYTSTRRIGTQTVAPFAFKAMQKHRAVNPHPHGRTH